MNSLQFKLTHEVVYKLCTATNDTEIKYMVLENCGSVESVVVNCLRSSVH